MKVYLNSSKVVVVAMLLTGLAACDRKTQAAATKGATAVPVVLRPVKTLPVQRTVDVVGTLYGEEETVVSAKVPGRIIALFKDVGDEVAPGEALVQLKQNDYQLALNKAQLAMQEALSKLGLTDLPPKDFDVTRVPTVVKARLQAENAQKKFDRGKKLFEADPPLMSEQDFSDLDTALRVAKSTYDVELLAARTLVAEALSLKGDVEIANQRLTDATTRAPSNPEPTTQPVDTGRRFDQPHTYVVTARFVNVGELVREITPCYRLVDDNPIKLRAKVPERFVAEVRTGQKVKAAVEAFPGVEFAGVVARVNPQIDAENRTFQIEVLMPNDDHRLRAGSFCRASVETRVDPAVTFAPQEAVITFAGVNKVFTVKDGKALEINVEPGEARSEDKSYVEIASGLQGGEDLVVSGTSKLATGVAVAVNGKPAAMQATTKATR